jgi:hypothetical protein
MVQELYKKKPDQRLYPVYFGAPIIKLSFGVKHD